MQTYRAFCRDLLPDELAQSLANALTHHPKPVLSGLIYVFVDDVDSTAAHLDGKVPFDWGPETQDYGLRELGIHDLNGYYLVFAQDA